MQDLDPFVIHFSRLVWLLANRPHEQDGQKEELRRSLMHLSSQPQVVQLRELTLAVAEAPDAGAETVAGLKELAVRMSGHSVRMLEFEAAAPVRDVFQIAQALASNPSYGDDGAAFDEKVVALFLTGVTAHLGGSGFVRHPTPGALPAQEGPMRTNTPVPPVTAQPAPQRQSELERARAAGELQAMMQVQMIRMASRDESITDLLARIDQAAESPAARAMVDDIVRTAEDLASQNSWPAVIQVMQRLHHHHERLHDGDVKRAFVVGIRRLQRPTMLQGVARQLPSHRDLRETCTRLLNLAGETGADVLIDSLIGSEVSGERRVYLDALRQCPAAVNSLLHLLSDDRWYVVRNAVALLGELGPAEADKRVVELMSHRESRVRQAAAAALGRLGTSRSLLALLQGLNDTSPDVRMQSVLAIAAAKNPRAVPWLIEALDHEQDADVQSALISALGAVPTEDGVARLVRAAEAGGRLIRKPTIMRVRAIEALAEAGMPSARQALQSLLQDRDREIRAAAEQAVGRMSA
jgi:hypothetical protein